MQLGRRGTGDRSAAVLLSSVVALVQVRPEITVGMDDKRARFQSVASLSRWARSDSRVGGGLRFRFPCKAVAGRHRTRTAALREKRQPSRTRRVCGDTPGSRDTPVSGISPNCAGRGVSRASARDVFPIPTSSTNASRAAAATGLPRIELSRAGDESVLDVDEARSRTHEPGDVLEHVPGSETADLLHEPVVRVAEDGGVVVRVAVARRRRQLQLVRSHVNPLKPSPARAVGPAAP
jgi:hypothetical protein